MPVLFKGRSEYNRHYKWNPSYRSASFSPKRDQSANDAGLRSDEIVSSHEPRITAKKKVWHREPEIQRCLLWWPESGTEEGSSYEGEVVTLPRDNEQNGDASPVMKAYRKKQKNKMTPKRKVLNERRSRSMDGSIAVEREFTERKSLTSKKQAKVIERHHPRKKASQEESLGQMRSVRSPKKNTDSHDNMSKFHPENAATKRSSPKVTKALNESAGHTSDEGQEKNPKKYKQSSSNIPLQHKAGLHARKPQRLSKVRLTEYQTNFAPKVSAKPSPILSAVDVVHSSSPAIPPHTGMKFHPTSEYLAKFKSGPSPPRKTTELSANIQTAPPSPSMKLKVKDIQKPLFAVAKKKETKSEYAAQYEASTEFEIGKLREMAESNKQRHQGTHIDPEHATQIASRYNKCWEASSDGSSMKHAPGDTEKGDDNEPLESEETPEEQWSKASQKGTDTSTLTEAGTEVEADSLEDSSASRDVVVKKLNMDEEHGSDDDLDSKVSLEGRVPTPRLHDIGGALRTHHDLTTPSKGGALLISSAGFKGTELSGSYISSKTSTRFSSPVAGSPTHDEQKLLKGREHALVRSSPCQVPSQQTTKAKQHPSGQTSEKLRPSSAKKLFSNQGPSSGRPLTGSSPIARHTTPRVAVRTPIRGSLKNQEFQHCGPTGRVQTAPAFARIDDDALSVASSATTERASELLRRAKERKSFWTTA